MSSVASPLDAYSAIAEPRRRRLLDLLTTGERPVGDIVRELGCLQPLVSKHLSVLRRVGLVAVRRQGRQKMYRLDAEALRPIHDWVKSYAQFWKHHLNQIKTSAEAKVKRPAE